MTDRPSKAVSSSKRISLLAGLALLLVPVIGRADSSNLPISADKLGIVSLAAPTTRQLPMPQDAVDKFKVTYGDISFSIRYGAGEPTTPHRERSGLLSPDKTVAGLGNLTVKVEFVFF